MISNQDDYTKKYVRLFEDIKYGDQIGQIIRQINLDILSRMVNEEGSIVLDIGAGTGWASIFLAIKRGTRPVALDASEEMLEYAKKKAKTQNVDLEVIRADAHMLPIRDTHIDYVISFRTLMHLKKIKKAISEMCRVSNYVILDFPSSISIPGILMTIGKFSIFDELIYNIKRNPSKFSKLSSFFSGKKTFFSFYITKEFERRGFTVIDNDKFFVLPVFFHRVLNKIFPSLKLEEIFKKSNIISRLGSPIVVKAKRNRM